MIRFVIGVFALGFVIANPPAIAVTSTVAQAYKQVLKVGEASAVTEVLFAMNSSELDADAQSQLQELVRLTKGKGDLRAVKVLAWADKEYPEKDDRAHGSDDRKLASERAAEVAGFFQDRYPRIRTEVHNMAERPHELEKLFSTSDARVKRDLEKSGLMTPEQGKLPGHAGRVLVLLTLKGGK